ncbi:hypothetical protein HXX76_015116 [Chlamydomonas incerta]|uniref:PDZ domain-containing protein n=1 Tax=Chlamydomonas incerta TaxID=51695 RepID=A0A835SAI9_CHLIN|nr:hypothetical protein HXX76_015116 [Chlamydomonas incerta]|eukprot:KAG2423727.1 hypothetical protein HXX76_015116 [Chlamydomonas incerta]
MSFCISRGAVSGCAATARRSSLRSRRVVSIARCSAAPAESAGAAPAEPTAAATTKVTIRKPLGLVFEQARDGGPIFVAEVTAGGNADKTGAVAVGDILSRCSAVVLKAGKEGRYENEGYGERPYDNWEVIDYDCEGKEFKTVMTALRSNNERWGKMDVTLQLRKP